MQNCQTKINKKTVPSYDFSKTARLISMHPDEPGWFLKHVPPIPENHLGMFQALRRQIWTFLFKFQVHSLQRKDRKKQKESQGLLGWTHGS